MSNNDYQTKYRARPGYKEKKVAYDAAYRAANKDRQKAYRDAHKAERKAYAVIHADRIRAVAVKYEKTHKAQKADAALRRKHGMTLAQRNQMEQAQHGLCAVYGKPPSGKGRNSKLHVDHDHTTGEVRALCCHKCNNALGLLLDDPVIAERAVAYLKKYNGVRACRLVGVCA